MTADSNLPAPLVPPGTDITGLPGFLLDVEKLFASELWALSTPEEFKAAVALWGRAWQQSPPGSLPNDERVLSRFSGAGARWKKVREMALRGFVLCSDGKWYHKTLSSDVLRAAESKRQRKARTAAASAAKSKPTDGDPGPEKPTKTTNGHDRYEDRYGVRNDHRDDVRGGVTRQTVTTPVTTSHRSNREVEEERKKEGEAPAVVCTPPRDGADFSDIPFLPPVDEAEASSATPRLATPWASKENLARVETTCRRVMRSGGPQDLRVSPIAKLESQGFDLENEILPALIDIDVSTEKPFKSWVHLAMRVRERILAERKLTADVEKRAADGILPDTKMITLGHLGDFAEPVLRRYLEAWRESPSCWFAFLGPKPGEPGCLIPARLLEMVEAA